jgi:hypothetical protein
MGTIGVTVWCVLKQFASVCGSPREQLTQPVSLSVQAPYFTF